MNATNATMSLQADSNAQPLAYAFQTLRIAVAAEAARRIQAAGDPSRMTVETVAPGRLDITAQAEEMSALLVELEKAQVYAPVTLAVAASGDIEVQDFAEYLRDRTDTVVVIATPIR